MATPERDKEGFILVDRKRQKKRKAEKTEEEEGLYFTLLLEAARLALLDRQPAPNPPVLISQILFQLFLEMQTQNSHQLSK